MSDSSSEIKDAMPLQTPQNTPSTGFNLSRSTLEQARQDLNAKKQEGSVQNQVQGLIHNPAMLSMIQGRLSTLVGKSSGYVESLPADVHARIFALKGLQNDSEGIQVEYREKMLELERKYEKMYDPLFKRRAEIVQGISEPKPEEFDHEFEVYKNNSPDVKGISNFWLTCLQNVYLVAEMISSRDIAALEALVDIRFANLSENEKGYRLEFEFSPNDYFSNEVLTKTYYYKQELSPTGEFLYDRAEGSEIEWKGLENNLTVNIETKKQRNKRTNQTRLVRSTVPADSFFNFFAPPQVNEMDESDSEDGLEDKTELLELDYQLGEIFKDQIIPLAVECYLGNVENDEFEDDEDEDEDEFSDENGQALDESSDEDAVLSSELSD
ncbi:nucleosome assembly protein Nap2 [Schizosaccharomyces cryophilus OY26]|uniref:Nucleosome assembly protein Nap2 n=1 Tax=Schizosaccharomyces cryophilus (strain OY26 / ATCC MYA-4695 / CBS 11777 / NBRC 106824 / NRRL Y48691) TaxID=653667 RepID=S9X9X7_SCHCR|nr:nucleosome assembly protein Nap2 [Schizosaccharomyces cryophilus OY26]EPY53937.1 nucleosome assembly protein Nap2 [Schizosaccharomyces cryophilus OY26]